MLQSVGALPSEALLTLAEELWYPIISLHGLPETGTLEGCWMTHCPSAESMQLTFVATVVMAHVTSGCSPSKEQLSVLDTVLMCLITPPVLAKVFGKPGHLNRVDEGPVEIGIVPAAAADNDSDDPGAAAVSDKCITGSAVACAGQRRLGGV